MPEEIDPFAINEQADTESKLSSQGDTLVDDAGLSKSSESSSDEILDSIHSVPNPVQAPSIEKESILSRVKPRGRKNRRTPPPVDGVTPYDSATDSKTSTEEKDKKTQTSTSTQKLDSPPISESVQAEQQQFEDIPVPVQEAPYQESVYPQTDYQQSQLQSSAEQQAPGYTNPLLTNQPLPVNYTTPNVYDPYNPYATMVDINPESPIQGRKTDWRFVITLGVAIICFIGVIFFWIMWGSTTTSLQDATVQMRELETKAETGQKAANQLTDLQTTIRELNTKIEDLEEENDELKKNEDTVKELEKEVDSLGDKVKSLQNENATLTEEVATWKKKYYDSL